MEHPLGEKIADAAEVVYFTMVDAFYDTKEAVSQRMLAAKVTAAAVGIGALAIVANHYNWPPFNN
jgi:hypothetical protein